MTINQFSSEFSFSTFVVRFRALTPVFLPQNSGSTFHGAFGQAFYRTECRRPGKDCGDCYLQNDCLYYRYFFRTSQGTRQPVRPYVLEAPPGDPKGFQPGRTFSILFTLIGESLQYLLRFFAVFETMGKLGFGKGRERGQGCCSLDAVHNLDNEGPIPIYPPKKGRPWPPVPVLRIWPDFVQETNGPIDRLTVQFLTPARIQHQGKLVDAVPFSILVTRLLKRIEDLDREYCGGALNIPVAALIRLAETEVEMVEERLAWQDWERYSAHQDTRMKLGGVVGEAAYQGNLTPFVPYLLLGEYLHVGKQATFGNGVIRVNF